MVERCQLLRPGRFCLRNQVFAFFAPKVASRRAQLRQYAARHGTRIADNADINLFGQANAVGIDVDLDEFGGFGPIVHSIARQG